MSDVLPEYIAKFAGLTEDQRVTAFNEAPSVIAQMINVSLEDPDAVQTIQEAVQNDDEDIEECSRRVVLVVAVLLLETNRNADALALEFVRLLENSPQIRSDWKALLQRWVAES